jgi:hypothetical protein
MTYHYKDQTACLGPIPDRPDPHAHLLCRGHADSMTFPRGWQVVRIEVIASAPGEEPDSVQAMADDVAEVVADAVRTHLTEAFSDDDSPGPARRHALRERVRHLFLVRDGADA